MFQVGILLPYFHQSNFAPTNFSTFGVCEYHLDPFLFHRYHIQCPPLVRTHLVHYQTNQHRRLTILALLNLTFMDGHQSFPFPARNPRLIRSSQTGYLRPLLIHYTPKVRLR